MNFFKHTYISYKLNIAFSLLCIVLAYIFSLVGFVDLSNLLFLITILFFCGNILLNFKKYPIDIARQLCIILAIIALFWDLSAINTPIEIVNKKIMLSGILGFNSCTIVLFLQGKYKTECLKKIRDIFLHKKALLAIIVLFIILNFCNFNMLFRSDSLTYYREITKLAGTWNFTFNNVDIFFLCGHTTISVSILYFIGFYLIPTAGIGIRLIQLLFGCYIIYAFYDITTRTFKKLQYFQCILLTFIFTFSPLFFGIFYELSTDLPLLCFFIIFLQMNLRKKNILKNCMFAATCFAKEPGIVICFGYVLGEFLGRCSSRKQLFSKQLFIQYLMYAIAPIILVLGFLFKSTWFNIISTDTTVKSVNISDLLIKKNSIGFNLDYIVRKIEGLFVLHFQWIITTLVIIFMIYLIYKIAKKKFLLTPVMTGIIFSYMAFICFNFLFITYLNYRYLIPQIFYSVFFLSVIVSEMSVSENLKNILLSVIALLFLGECFYTFDPISLNLYSTLDIGKGKIISTKTFIPDAEQKNYFVHVKNEPNVENFVLLDGGATNRQILGIEEIIESALQEIKYDDDKIMVIDELFYDDTTTMYNLLGNNHIYNLYWNQAKKQITDNSEDINIHFLSSTDYLNNTKNTAKKYYYFEFNINNTKRCDYSNVSKKLVNTYSAYGWNLKVYELKNGGKI